MDRLDYAIKDIKFSIEHAEKEIKKSERNKNEIVSNAKSYLLGLKRALEIMENLGMDK